MASTEVARRTARSLDRVENGRPQRSERRFGRTKSDPRPRGSRNIGNESLPPIESANSLETNSKDIIQHGPCGPGTNIYGKVLGATADETILVGLQMIKRLTFTCPTPQTETGPVAGQSEQEKIKDEDHIESQIQIVNEHNSEEEVLQSVELEEEIVKSKSSEHDMGQSQSSEKVIDKDENSRSSDGKTASSGTYPSLNGSRITQASTIDSGIDKRTVGTASKASNVVEKSRSVSLKESRISEKEIVENRSGSKGSNMQDRSDEDRRTTLESEEEEVVHEPSPIAAVESYSDVDPEESKINAGESDSETKSIATTVKSITSSHGGICGDESQGKLSDCGSKPSRQSSGKISAKSGSSDSSPSTRVGQQDSKTSRGSSTRSDRDSSGASQEVKLQLSKSQSKEATRPKGSSSILKGSSSSSKSKSDTSERFSCTFSYSDSSPEKTDKEPSTLSSCCSCQKRKDCPVRKSCFKETPKICEICCRNSKSSSSKSVLEMVGPSRKKVRVCCDCSTSTSSCMEASLTDGSMQKGDGYPLQGRVRYSITKITDYGEFTTFEVMKSTKKTPKTMPNSLEGVFVLRKVKSRT